MDEHSLIYYIKWKYYSKKTWEPKKSLKGYKYTLLKFYKQYPEKPRPLDWAQNKRDLLRQGHKRRPQ